MLLKNNSIYKGSFNPNDDNCLLKANENMILLSGTYYDVILLCHEIAHKLRYDNNGPFHNITNNFFFETPSIIFELAANNYLRDYYGVNIYADELRKKHILSIIRENNIEKTIFLIIIKLLQEKKLNSINLYLSLNTNEITKYLNNPNNSLENCIDEMISIYSYDIGYILANYVNKSNNKINIINKILKYKDKGFNKPFTIKEEIIKTALSSNKYIK